MHQEEIRREGLRAFARCGDAEGKDLARKGLALHPEAENMGQKCQRIPCTSG